MEGLGAELFDADIAARRLLENDETVRSRVRREFGDAAVKENIPDRAFIRGIVFGDPAKKRALEQILHPRIHEEWLRLVQQNKLTPGHWCIVDIPLLYETEREKLVDRVVVVACSAATQLARLRQTRRLSAELATQMMESQMNLEMKMARADHVVWNDGDAESLREQAALFTDFLIRHG